MMKRLVRILTVAAIMLTLATNAAFAATSEATMKTIPGTRVKADSRVVDAFVELGFTVQYDKSMSYAGLFSVSKHAIIMKNKKSDNLLHEMGHFVSRLQGGADESEEFVAIYKAENRKYKGKQKAYVTQNSKEYFAQSFMEYTKNPAKLQKNRPQTYEFVKEQVDTIEQKLVDDMYAAYGWAW